MSLPLSERPWLRRLVKFKLVYYSYWTYIYAGGRPEWCPQYGFYVHVLPLLNFSIGGGGTCGRIAKSKALFFLTILQLMWRRTLQPPPVMFAFKTWQALTLIRPYTVVRGIRPWEEPGPRFYSTALPQNPQPFIVFRLFQAFQPSLTQLGWTEIFGQSTSVPGKSPY